MALTKITTSVVAVNSLTTANIADNSIDATKIASNSILTRHIDDAQITTDQILDGTIATADIADDAVTEDKLANAINTSIAAKLPLAGGTMTGTIAGFTSTGIDDNADATAITISSSEKVGIGIDPTEGILHIKSDGAGEVELLTLENSTGTDGKTTLTFKTTSTDSTKSAQIFAERVNASGHTDLGFRTFNGSTTEAARIDHDGNVGIGEQGPAYRLHVDGTNVLSGGGLATFCVVDRTAYNGTNPGAGITLRGIYTSGGNTTNFATIQGIKENTSSGNYATALRFTTRANSADLKEQMRIDSAGKVGIGTDSPDGLLHISSGNSGDAILIIEADADNDTESDNPQLWFKQDGDNTEGAVRLADNKLQIINNVNSAGGIEFLTGSNLVTGTSDPATGATTKMQLTTAGSLQVGTTSTTNQAYKIESYAGDYYQMMLRAPTYPTLKFKADNQNSGNNAAISVGGNNSLVLQPNNTTNGIIVSNSGHVTMPNQPAFHAYGPSASVADGSYVVYTNTYVNTGSHYSTSNGRFTAPVAGVYLFFWSAIGNSTSDVYRWFLRKNGSATGIGGNDVHLRQDTSGTGSEYATNGSRVQMVSLSANDYIQIYHDSDGGTPGYYQSDYVNFGGYLIG